MQDYFKIFDFSILLHDGQLYYLLITPQKKESPLDVIRNINH